MRPRRMAAENVEDDVARLVGDAQASMRPRRMAAENLCRALRDGARGPSLQ